MDTHDCSSPALPRRHFLKSSAALLGGASLAGSRGDAAIEAGENPSAAESVIGRDQVILFQGDWAGDGVHPTPAGAALMAHSWIKAVQG